MRCRPGNKHSAWRRESWLSEGEDNAADTEKDAGNRSEKTAVSFPRADCILLLDASRLRCTPHIICSPFLLIPEQTRVYHCLRTSIRWQVQPLLARKLTSWTEEPRRRYKGLRLQCFWSSPNILFIKLPAVEILDLNIPMSPKSRPNLSPECHTVNQVAQENLIIIISRIIGTLH